MSFKEFNFHAEIFEAIEKAGYTTPTSIQYKAIPKILGGFDICASAQTGTGKTASFLLPALQGLLSPCPIKARGPRVLILVPTRELAMQVSAEAIKFSENLSRVKTVCLYGGFSYVIQNRQLSRPYEILVATPGRLLDHIERGNIDLGRVQLFILDEADRMLDMGFIKPVEQIAGLLPKQRQTLLFSATLGKNVLKLTENLLTSPLRIQAAAEQAKHENIEQRLQYVNNLNDKNRALDYLLNDASVNQAVIFTSTKRQAETLLHVLLDQGHSAAALHGDMDQRQRNRTINAMRMGEKRFLVATDVAARGIDIHTITHVVNFDLPNNVEDYVHRIGRTGRANAKGTAISLATPREKQMVARIEKFTGRKIELHSIPGFEVDIQAATKPSQRKRHFARRKPNFRKSP